MKTQILFPVYLEYSWTLLIQSGKGGDIWDSGIDTSVFSHDGPDFPPTSSKNIDFLLPPLFTSLCTAPNFTSPPEICHLQKLNILTLTLIVAFDLESFPLFVSLPFYLFLNSRWPFEDHTFRLPLIGKLSRCDTRTSFGHDAKCDVGPL